MCTPIHIVRAEYRKEHVVEERWWYSTVLKFRRVLFLSSNPEFNLQRFRLQVVLNMDAHRNPRRALKSAQEQEDRRKRRNKRQRSTCCRDSGTKERKIEKAEGEGSCQAYCLNCSWKTSYLTAEKYPWTPKNGPQWDYSGWAPTSTKSWQLKLLRWEKADENQPAWKVGSWNPRGERKITADENQPAWKVGSWNPWRERKKITVDENQPPRKVGSWNPWGERKKIIADEHQPAQKREHSILCKLFCYNMKVWCKLF